MKQIISNMINASTFKVHDETKLSYSKRYYFLEIYFNIETNHPKFCIGINMQRIWFKQNYHISKDIIFWKYISVLKQIIRNLVIVSIFKVVDANKTTICVKIFF